MICELCGKTVNEGFKVRLEGGLVSACTQCANLGEIVQSVKPLPKAKPQAVLAPAPQEPLAAASDTEFDVVEGFGTKVKTEREKRNMSQEDLGRAVNEPHSVIHRVELGKLEPTEELARKLEHALRIRLLAKHEELDDVKQKSDKAEITLGDMVVVRKRGG